VFRSLRWARGSHCTDLLCNPPNLQVASVPAEVVRLLSVMHLLSELSSHSLPISSSMNGLKREMTTPRVPPSHIQCRDRTEFYVIVRESGWPKHVARLSEACEALQSLFNPRAGPNLGLPYGTIGIRVPKAIHLSITAATIAGASSTYESPRLTADIGKVGHIT
jgi:hypothetical protein